MVVETRDPLASLSGLAPDAEGDMPADDQLEVPYGDDDALPSDDAGADEAATEDDASADDDPDAQRAAIRSEIETTIRGEEQEKARQDLSKLQSSLQSQINTLAKQNQRLAAQGQLREQWFQNYLTQVSSGEHQPDPRDFAVFESDLNKAAQQVQVTEQQQLAQAQQWASGSMQRMTAFVQQQATGPNGETLFDVNDPELVKLGNELHAWGHHAVANNDMAAVERNKLAHAAHQARAKLLREQGLLGLSAAARQQKAKQQQGVRDKERARGPQNVARGGGAGTGATDFATYYSQAERELKASGADKGQIYLRAMELESRTRQPQPRR